MIREKETRDYLSTEQNQLPFMICTEHETDISWGLYLDTVWNCGNWVGLFDRASI